GLAGRMLPVFAAAIDQLAAHTPRLHAIVPTVAGTEALVRAQGAGWRVPWTAIGAPADKRAAFAAAEAALTGSGTGTLERAVAGLPMVVGYRVSRLTEFLARRLIEVPHVAMPNLIAGRALVPEMLQDDCVPERLAAEMERLLGGSEEAAHQRQGL